jgi:asparagine synthase (glutamine-hydrolysing)
MHGELRNLDALHANLAFCGRRLYIDDDTTILLHNFANGGLSGLMSLEGDFIAAIVDLDRQALLIYRSSSANQPLYYARTTESLTFASSPAGLLVPPDHDTSPAGEMLQTAFQALGSGEIVEFTPYEVSRC